MRAAVVTFILLACAVAFVAGLNTRHDRTPLLIDVAFPLQQSDVIPWTLNTRCTVNHQNLPQRDPERNA